MALAKLNLSYTEMAAPFDGACSANIRSMSAISCGNSPVDPTQLVTIEQIVPIYVNFSINMRGRPAAPPDQ